MGLDAEEALNASYAEVLGDKHTLIGAVGEYLESKTSGSRYFGRHEMVESRLFDVYGSPLINRRTSSAA